MKTKHWTKKQQLKYNRRLVNNFFKKLETRGGVVGDKTVLFCYDKKRPEMSFIITEQI